MGDLKQVKVTAVNSSGIFELQGNEGGIMKGVGGIEFEFLKLLSNTMHFDYEIIYPKGGGWGFQESDGMYSGMMGVLQRKEADLAMVNIFLSLERLQIVDFSFPYTYDQMTFALRKPALKRHALPYFHCFDNWVWTFFAASIIALSIIGTIMMTLPILKMKTMSIWTKMLMAAEIIIGMRDHDVMGHSLAVRTFVGTKLVAFVFLTLIYSSVFLSFLSAPLKKPPITTFNGLLKASQKNKIKPCLLEHNSDDVQYFVSGRTLRSEWEVELKKCEKNPLLHQSPVVRMLNNFALISTKTKLEMQVSRDGLSHIADVPSGYEKLSFVGIAFRKEFCCIQRFDDVILRLIETGIYQKLAADYMFKLQLKATEHRLEVSSSQIKLSDIASLLYIFVPCYLFALLIFLLEIVICRGKKQRKTSRKIRKFSPYEFAEAHI